MAFDRNQRSVTFTRESGERAKGIFTRRTGHMRMGVADIVGRNAVLAVFARDLL
jgi:hypothetical protein